MSKVSVLLVDDEPSVLKVLQKAMLSTIECDISTAACGEEALRMMEQGQFDVIVSDINMPGMDGTALLAVVAELHPQMLRLVFCGKGGGETGLKTASSAHQFYLKPTDIRLIAAKIKNIMRLRDHLPAEGLDQMISHIRTLPSIPAIYTAVENELKQHSISMDKVGKLVEQDVAMSAKLLQLVNSAFFGMRERVNKPSQAAVLLGGSVLKSLLLGMHVFTEWSKKAVPGFSIQDLWSHSLNVATYARELAILEGCDKEMCEEIYTAGLFHDIGKVILADNLPESCDRIQTLIGERKLSLVQAERGVLGATHAEAGAYLMAMWGFSDSIVNACVFHHQPMKCEQSGFNSVTAVHAANVFDYENSVRANLLSEVFDRDYLAREGFTNRIESWRQAISHQTA